MSNRLDWIHALLINREAGARTEMPINDIPESIDLRANLGTSISLDMTVPDAYRRAGPAVDSMMMQHMQWMDGSWWPATIFLTDVPDAINLTTEPDLDFDITKSLAFQGTPVLDFSVVSSDTVSKLAGPLLDQVRVGVQETSVADPLHDIDEALDEVSMVETAAPQVIHPEPYIILTDENSRPPGEVRTIWSTLFNLTDYVIWTRYVDDEGNVVEQSETITFLTSLLSLFDSETEFLLHQVDIDQDGDDDIQVGLSIEISDV